MTVRIAHGYGNRRNLVAQALDAGVDMIEADLRYHRGDIWIRHERRLGLLPVLYNWRLSRGHRRGPFAVTIGPWFLRLDVKPIRLEELIRTVGDRCALLLDLKGDDYSDQRARSFLRKVARHVKGHRTIRAEFCGSWRLLDLLREVSPGASLVYSVDDAAHWEAVVPRMNGGDMSAISLRYNLLDAPRADVLRNAGVQFYCWAVSNAREAQRAVDLGASGVIASLEVLQALSSMKGAVRP